jgi:hypothetical protein
LLPFQELLCQLRIFHLWTNWSVHHKSLHEAKIKRNCTQSS